MKKLTLAVLVLVSLGAAYQSTDLQRIEQAKALMKELEPRLTSSGVTNARTIATRLETLKTQLSTPSPGPIPAPTYVEKSVFDATVASLQTTLTSALTRIGVLEKGTTPTPEVCGNGVDDDRDGQVDEGCAPQPILVEVCGNGLDDDKDGQIDEGCAPLPIPSGSHGYFDALVAHPSHAKSYSFREASQLAASAAPWVTYDPASDTDPQRQDGVKVRIPVWHHWLTASLAQDITDTQTVFPINLGGQNFENGLSYLVGSEIMTQVSRTSNTVTVTRGQFGTTATAHPSGRVIQRNTNSLPSGSQKVDIQTDGSVSATYLITWDGYWTDSYAKSGLHNHKSQQIASWKDGNQWAEMQTVFSGPPSCCPNPAWTSADVAAGEFRWYGQSFTKGFIQNPGQPMASPPWVIQPSVWTRFWVLVEANTETDHGAFANVTTLAADVPDAAANVIRVHHNFGNEYNPLTSTVGVVEKVDVSPGRAIRVGGEVMTIVSGDATGLVRNLTVRRGQQGTTAAAHTNGAAVQAIDDYITVWMADEKNAPRKLYDRVSLFLPIDAPTPAQRGSLGKFWIEFNTSTQQLPAERAAARMNARNGDLVAYLRNLVMLKNPGDVTPFLVKPQR